MGIKDSITVALDDSERFTGVSEIRVKNTAIAPFPKEPAGYREEDLSRDTIITYTSTIQIMKDPGIQQSRL